MKKKMHIYTIVLLLTPLISSAKNRKVSLLFAGDAMQHQVQIDAAKTKDGYDYSSYFKHIKEYTDKADISIVNLEVTLAGKPHTGYPSFSAPDEFALELKNAGFEVFLTANNHILDKGQRGFKRTLSQLDSLRVRHLGTYTSSSKRDLLYPMMIIKNGIRIAMLNYTYGTNDIKVREPNIVNYINRDSILKDIDLAKRMYADVIIANMHWGDEYRLYQNKTQERLADFLIENGVNIIIGGHPHVVQPIDIRKENNEIKQVIVYSMGNFVSGMRAPNTDGGMLVNIDIHKDDNNEIKIDKCEYHLVWVHKPIIGRKMQQEVIPVSTYQDEASGIEYLGEGAYNKMMRFATKAKKATEIMWNKE